MPAHLHIFNNDSVLPADVPTVAHAMGAAGYHAVLIGRMHFKGEEQKGFSGQGQEPVVIQQILDYRGEPVMAEAVLFDRYKAVRFGGAGDLLYNMETDPEERYDVSARHPEILKMAEPYFLSAEKAGRCIETEKTKRKQQELLKAWGKAKKPAEWAVMPPPEWARRKPVEQEGRYGIQKTLDRYAQQYPSRTDEASA